MDNTNVADPNATEKVQPKNRGGRPPGRKNLHSRDAVRRLVELRFDPIEELINSHDEIVREIDKENRKEKPSLMHISTMHQTKATLIKELLRYGYARTTETTVAQTQELPKMSVTLTPEGFKPGDTVPVLTNGNITEEPTEIIDNDSWNGDSESQADTYVNKEE